LTDAPNPAPPPPLSAAGIILRLAVVGGAVACVAGVFAYTAGWLTPNRLTPDKMLGAIEGGQSHPGFRFNHAKGLCATGYFEASGQAVTVSKASVFMAGRTPVNGRFSLAGPAPDQSDAPAKVRALGLRLVSADGQEWRTAMINLPVFVVNQPKDFYDFNIATTPVAATGNPDPAKMKAFLKVHPATAKALGLVKANPLTSGFGDTKYNSLNAFRFTNAQGATTPVRWSFVPLQPVTAPDPAKAKNPNPNYLFDDVIAQVRRHPLQWKLMLTLGQSGDATKDATVPWPTHRQQVDAGTLTLDQVASEDGGKCTDINYDPLVLPAGMAPSDDPLLSARSAAYSRSFTRRIEAAKQKPPSAITPQAAQTGGAA
jgi:catalase